MTKKFSITKKGGVYHLYDEVPPKGRDPLEKLLIGKSRCGVSIYQIVNSDTAPSPISSHDTVAQAIEDGLYCGNCSRKY